MTKLLLCRVASRLIGLPIELVIEIMRPLPVEPVPGTPDFLSGLSIVRGVPVPVVEAGKLLGEQGRPGRFVAVRAGQRTVALAVGQVIGVRTIAAESLTALPPLLRNAPAAVFATIGTLDAELLLVLQSTHLVPEEFWVRAAETVHS